MKKSWTKKQLGEAVIKSSSVRQVIICLGLRPAGGNYVQIQKYIKEYKLNKSHFKGKAWNKGMTIPREPLIPLSEILVIGSTFQSYKLKKRLFKANIKKRSCEECGWAVRTKDGYLPLELDHINGNRYDNRLENLRILCPNCHALKPTHRGRNKKKKNNAEMVE